MAIGKEETLNRAEGVGSRSSRSMDLDLVNKVENHVDRHLNDFGWLNANNTHIDQWMIKGYEVLLDKEKREIELRYIAVGWKRVVVADWNRGDNYLPGWKVTLIA